MFGSLAYSATDTVTDVQAKWWIYKTLRLDIFFTPFFLTNTHTHTQHNTERRVCGIGIGQISSICYYIIMYTYTYTDMYGFLLYTYLCV